ncbi:receptor protein kinase TMK1-like [Phoenix dactylifera]|uniref:Receptor protein kinase TMK1-like n=1 Tax=Phoenix dactylifera TaxID=42345 RepID=A0A8B7C0U9_PHODC|nr:receptor protein kinase TMK1-like [Phoenix dactylifera]
MEKKARFPCHRHLLVLVVTAVLFSAADLAAAQLAAGDAAAMRTLAKSLDPASKLGWLDSSDPCDHWVGVRCSGDRVVAIQVGNRGLSGVLPPDIRNLTALTRLELMSNRLSGPIPSLTGLATLETLFLANNNFSSIPGDFFSGLYSLTNVYLDNNPFAGWSIPPSLRDASGLLNFSANIANLTGTIPDFLADGFPSFYHLALAYNYLEGPLPSAFSGFSLSSLWLNNQKGSRRLSGSIDVIRNMTNLKRLQLQSNSFSGPIPDLSRLENLHDLNLRDNKLTGPVPSSLTSLKSLENVILTNNLLQGPVPVFPKTMKKVDLDPRTERFCVDEVGVDCDPRVNVLLSIAESFGYPIYLADNWRGNDPCQGFTGITCDPSGNITLVVLQNLGLNGTISQGFQLLPKLQKLLLSGNNLTGTIPSELTNLKYLQVLDVSRNALWGNVPRFGGNVSVNTDGNPDIGRDGPPPPNSGYADDGGRKKSTAVMVGSIVAVLYGVLLAGILLGFCYCKRRKQSKLQRANNIVIHHQHSGSDMKLLKATIASNESSANRLKSIEPDIAEPGSMAVSMQLLREVTNNFSEDNILGCGGFGTVYKGELHDGSMIAVKRMETRATGSKGLHQFKSEISVLTNVRHRHLVSLLGYCLEENERILIYEYMSQGELSRHLFDWMKAGLKPLEWKRRLTIALDVARGVEYLHNLANRCFIHRDLKPSNILLGDNMRAKVADFGLVRLVQEGNQSIETRLAGTFGYLDPEYAVMGRLTTKADVFSFGVILMELITGRKAIDRDLPEESMHLVTWFRRMHLDEETFEKTVDPNIIFDEETFKSIKTVADLSCYCTVRDPYRRPDMGYAVNVLSSLAGIWKPTDVELEDGYGIGLEVRSPQVFRKWLESTDGSQMDGTASSSYIPSTDTYQGSIHTRSPDFTESFTSVDSR